MRRCRVRYGDDRRWRHRRGEDEAKAENTHRSIGGLRVGVRAVVSPDCSVGEFVHVVTMVGAGDAMVMPGAARDGLARVAPDDQTSDLAARMASALTAREKEVLALKLSVAVATVRSHVHHLPGKLGVGSRGQAIAIAYEFGVVNAIRNRPAGRASAEAPGTLGVASMYYVS